MDRKPQPTDEGILVKAYLPWEEVTSPILLIGQANPNLLRELESILKSPQRVSIQSTLLPEGVKSPNFPSGRNGSIPPPLGHR